MTSTQVNFDHQVVRENNINHLADTIEQSVNMDAILQLLHNNPDPVPALGTHANATANK
jgi:hypothetical protein